MILYIYIAAQLARCRCGPTCLECCEGWWLGDFVQELGHACHLYNMCVTPLGQKKAPVRNTGFHRFSREIYI